MKIRKILLFLFLFSFFFSLLNCKPKTTPSPMIPPKEYIDYALQSNTAQGGELELPINGASGYAALDLPLYRLPDENSEAIALLKAGRGFTILEEKGDFLYIEVSGIQGWIKHHFCMINIPDVIPSIPHNNTNTYSSMFKTSGFDIPNITGKALYDMRDYNARMDREEYIAPVLYGMIRRIYSAQKAALADGNTLVIYEAFRPASPHNDLFDTMSVMFEENPVVRAGLSSGSFRSDLFLAPSPYNHQRGTAIDVSLARVTGQEIRYTGDYKYTHITSYEEYPMQSPMHELSVASAVYKEWVNSRNFTGWLSGEFSDSATAGTKLLQKYCTDAGLIPLASEWWHFNDLNWSPPLIEVGMKGEFFIEKTYSKPPLLITQ